MSKLNVPEYPLEVHNILAATPKWSQALSPFHFSKDNFNTSFNIHFNIHLFFYNFAVHASKYNFNTYFGILGSSITSQFMFSKCNFNTYFSIPWSSITFTIYTFPNTTLAFHVPL